MLKSIKKTVKTGDADFSQVLVHSFWAFIFLGIATGLQFLFDLFLARSFGASGSGIFYLSLSLLTLCALIGRLGFDRSVVRFLPPLYISKKLPQARGLIDKIYSTTWLISILLGLILYLLAPTLATNVFNDSSLSLYFRIFAVAIPVFAISQVDAGILRAIKLVKHSLVAERVLIYAGGLLVILLAPVGEMSIVFWGFVISCCLAALFGHLVIDKYIPRLENPISFNNKVLFASAIPLFVVSLANMMFGQVNVLILGALMNTDAVGIFNVAFKISYLMNLILTGINAIGATKFSELHADNKNLGTLAQKVAALGLVLAIPIFLACLIFPEQILSLFGPAFVAGASTLVVLAIGQFINTGLGSANHILAMTGHEKSLAVIIGFSLAINILTSLLLIPAHGIIGAGFAVTVSLIISNAIQLIMVKYYLNIWSLPFKPIKAWLQKLFK